jgi:hypothetical protein
MKRRGKATKLRDGLIGPNDGQSALPKLVI